MATNVDPVGRSYWWGDDPYAYRPPFTMPSGGFIFTVKQDNKTYIGDPPPGYHVVMRLEKINPTKVERPEDV